MVTEMEVVVRKMIVIATKTEVQVVGEIEAMITVKSAEKGAVEGNAALKDHGALGPDWMLFLGDSHPTVRTWEAMCSPDHPGAPEGRGFVPTSLLAIDVNTRGPGMLRTQPSLGALEAIVRSGEALGPKLLAP